MDMHDFDDEEFERIIGEEIEEFYCFCKSETCSIEKMIPCEGPDCKTKFFHPKCVGLKVKLDDGPSDWMCHECLGIEPPHLNSGRKKMKKSEKIESASIENSYTLTKAQSEAKELVLSTINKLESDYFNRSNSPCKEYLITMKSYLSDSTSEKTVSKCQELLEQLWPSVTAADDSKSLKSVKMERKLQMFHNTRISDPINTIFIEITEDLHMEANMPMLMIISQFIIQRLFAELLRKRCITSEPENPGQNAQCKLTETEEKVLRYTSGYICKKLLKHFKNFQKNEKAKACYTILCSLQNKESSVNNSNVLAYTKEWIEIVNRGGLFLIPDTVYLFFRSMELIVHSDLTNTDESLRMTKSQLMTKIENSDNVNVSFSEIIQDFDIDEKTKFYLFTKFITCWINLRLKAFSNVYMFVLKQEDSKLSKKSEKSMRRELNNEN